MKEFGKKISGIIKSRLEEKPRDFTLRMSNIGNPCVRQLWLQKRDPDVHSLDASTRLKFLYGDLIEELLFFLVKLSGHKVEGEQDEAEIEGIKGHRDRVIDGHLVDTKSASSFSFENFQKGLTPETDKFGYLPQLNLYLEHAQDDPLVTDKDSASFLVMDKQHGHILLDTHQKDRDIDWKDAVRRRVAEVNNDVMPPRAFEPLEDGYTHKDTKEFRPNGNLYLDTQCSYCNQKHRCHENIRTFITKGGKPKFFTKVVKEPKMFEVQGVVDD